MERAEVLQVLRDKAVEMLEVEAEAVREDKSFVEDLDVDSLSLVDFTMELEDVLGVELPALIVPALLGHVFKRRCSVPGSGKVQPSNALCTSVSSHQQPLELPSTSMVIISTLSHGNDTALSTGPPVEDEPEPPICGYNSEKPKDESVTYIEERTGDEITEYAHTADAASIARHLNVDPK